MKGNILVELRKVVNELYAEGYKEIFAFSIIKKGEGVIIQVADFDLEPVELNHSYVKTYEQAKKTMNLAVARYGDSCKAINARISDEISELVYLDNNNILVVECLNVNQN